MFYEFNYGTDGVRNSTFNQMSGPPQIIIK